MSEDEEVSEKMVKKEETKEEGRNIIYIGKKPLMSYALATLLQLSEGRKSVVLKARGRAISMAVDVAEIVRRRLLKGETLTTEIKIDTEIIGEDRRNVSTIEILLTRK